MRYEYARIRVLAEVMERFSVPSGTREYIMEGGDQIRRADKPSAKADWFRGAVARMDETMTEETRQAIRQECACCLGGARHKMAKEIYRRHANVEDRLKACDDAKLIFGHKVTRAQDGSIVVLLQPPDQPRYRCPCLPAASEPLSITYCYCCGGHVKHHLETALGERFECKVRSSSLSSGGTKPCVFVFRRVADKSTSQK